MCGNAALAASPDSERVVRLLDNHCDDFKVDPFDESTKRHVVTE